ncbi:hypothetical protein [Tardiphaga sp. 285_C5_N1_2]|uniref:hypothetical protein n=1 Tax=Tardiphaga sp. 285_C5_N1_2 TaxID=3240775 RepID=UPI003F8BFD40
MLELVKSYPLAYLLLVIGPVVAGIFGALVGYENLATRLRNDKQNDRIESRGDQIVTEVKELKVPIETLKRYEAQLDAAGQNTEVLKVLLRQYDQLTAATSNLEKFTGHADQADRVASADHILREIHALLGTTKLQPGPGGAALIIKTGQNTFRVTFAVPMRIPPTLEFEDLPKGVTPVVIEKTNIGFVVIFTPTTTAVEKISFTASAEL